MAKLNLQVFKKGKPIFWIIGGVVVFVVFYLMFNKGSGGASTGTTTVMQSGPSEALQAASLQASTAIQAAQISANVEATKIGAERDANVLAAQVALAQLSSGEHVALEQLEADRAAMELNASTNLLVNEQNLNYGLETARLAANTELGRKQIDANLLTQQLATNAAMFSEQLAANVHMFDTQSDNLIKQSIIGQVGSLKKGDRDNALISIALGAPSSHGSVIGPSSYPGLLH